MRTLVLTVLGITVLLSASSCTGRGKDGFRVSLENGTAVIYDTKAAEDFIALLRYVRNTYGNEAVSAAGENGRVQFDAATKRNRSDPGFSRSVNRLLSLPVYRLLASNMQAYRIPSKGKKAYRTAFYGLPLVHAGLRGGVDDQTARLLREMTDQRAGAYRRLLESLRSENSAKRIVEEAGRLLPQGTVGGGTYRVSVYFDGNRGSFQQGRRLYLDLMGFGVSPPIESVEHVISHELHHMVYAQFLKKHIRLWSPADILSPSRNTLREWRAAILLEGTAQFCTMEDMPKEIRLMQLDTGLAETFFREWQDTFLAALNGKLSNAELGTRLSGYSFDYAVARLDEYLTRLKDGNAVRAKLGADYRKYRPVLHYYVGYRIFRAIYDHGGRAAFLRAVENPRELLSLYREIAETDPSLPPISKATADAWASL